MQLIFVTTLAALSSIAFGLPSYRHSGSSGGSRDTCYNEVFHGPAQHIKDDCKSFLETVIEPCPVTSTSTVTITSFISVATTTAEPSVSLLSKRDPHCNDPPHCHPTTSKRGDIPHYADCCDGPSAYSSACAYLGVTPSTTTLSAKTVISTTTIEKIVTQTITRYATTVSKITNLQTFTSVSVTLSSSTYVSSTTFTTTTADATATACPIMESSGPNAGQYLAVDESNFDYLYWNSDLSQASYFTLDSQSRLVDRNGLFALALPDQSSFVPLQGTSFQPGDNGVVTLTCSFDNSQLSCSPTGGGANDIFITTNQQDTSQFLAFGEQDDLVDSGYSQITLVQVC